MPEFILRSVSQNGFTIDFDSPIALDIRNADVGYYATIEGYSDWFHCSAERYEDLIDFMIPLAVTTVITNPPDDKHPQGYHDLYSYFINSIGEVYWQPIKKFRVYKTEGNKVFMEIDR